MRVLFFFIAVFNITWSGLCQSYNFYNYSLEDGLPQSQVTDICQDQFGYLWIGTETGLSRFDGIRFENFSTDDGLPDNNIDKLFIDSKNKLWVATPKGIAYLQGSNFVAYSFAKDQTKEYRIYDLCEFKNEIHIATDEGLLLFQKDTFLLIQNNQEESKGLRSIINLGDTVLLTGSKLGLFKYSNQNFERYGVSEFDSLNISDIHLNQSKLIVSTYGFGIFVYDLTYQTTKWYALDEARVRAVYANSTSILCATKNGAIEITEAEIFNYSLENGLEFENVRSVFIDSEDNLWLGTDGKGLYRLTGKSIISFTKNDGLGSDAVMSISQDREGFYYFGTYDAGVTKWKKNGDTVYAKIFNRDLKNSTVWNLAVDNHQNCWVGSHGGIDIIESSNKVLPNKEFWPQSRIRTMVFLNDTVTIVAGANGVYWLTSVAAIPLFEEYNLDVNKILVYENHLYMATKTGLYVSNLTKNESNVELLALPENNVKSIEIDYLGNLWIGTNSSGIFIYQKDAGILPFTLDYNDSKSKTILAIISDSKNNIWTSTLNGVYQIERLVGADKSFRINHYGQPEGLITLECNQNALFEDAQHFIWAGTSEGLARINPKLNTELFSFKKPRLIITGIRLFMESFDYENYETEFDKITGVPKKITLPYNKNHLTFDFIGINLKDPKGVNYEYRLLGAEEEWSPITQNNYATYSFISHGEYDFEVRATNNSEEWSEIQRIRIIILPPFWLTWWFILGSILAGIFLVVFIFQTRIKSIKQKQENERLGYKNRLLFLEQQSLNASMNRHFIFNSLNSIQYFINSSNKLAANKYLTSFAKLIRKNLDSSTSDNFIVTLQEEIDRIELYLSLEKMRFEGKFDYVIDLEDDIPTDSIEIPSMLLQPFVENSIIHGVLPLNTKGLVEIKIYKEFGYLVFEVIDDGIGIDKSQELKKVKTEDHHESMGMEITNRRVELIRRLTGENLMIVGPYQLNNQDGNSIGTKVIIKINIESQTEFE